VTLDVSCLGSLSSARRSRAQSDGIFSFSIEQYICELMMPSMKFSSSSTHATPHKETTTIMFHYRHHAFFIVFVTFATPCSFEAISSRNIYLGLIIPEYWVLVFSLSLSAWALANSRRAVFVPGLSETCVSWIVPMDAIPQQCAPYCVTGNSHPSLAFYFFR